MTKKALNELRDKIPATVWAEKWGKVNGNENIQSLAREHSRSTRK